MTYKYQNKKLVILRQESPTSSNLHLFFGNNDEDEVFVIDINKQLAWLRLIANNLENHVKRNV